MKKFRVDVSKFKGRNVIAERELQKEKNILYKQTDVVNKMLKALKSSDLYEDSGAVENLLTYAGSEQVKAINNRGMISRKAIRTSTSMTKLTALNKSLNDFLKNKQSTVSGMKELYDAHTEELLKITDDVEWVDSLSFRQVKNIYKMFGTKEYERVNSALGSEQIFSPYVSAISEQWNKDKFINEILVNSGNVNDLDLRDALSDLYNSTIKGKIQYAKSKEK